jgi:hypothetical protein
VIWLLLRLHRTTLLLAAATTAVVAAGLAVYRPLSTNALAAAGIPQSCIADPTPDCGDLALALVTNPTNSGATQVLGGFWGYGHLVLLALPLVLGLLTGAGIIGRELGRDAHLLTLTQNVGRARWWTSRLALAGGVAVVGSVLVAGVAGWAFAPFDDLVAGRQPLQTPIFETSGIVPAGQALFACALGAVLGLLTRSAAGAAFATTIAYVVVLFVLASTDVRGAYLPPVTITADAYTDQVILGPPSTDGDWVLASRYLDAGGGVVPATSETFDEGCGDTDECLRGAGVVVTESDVQPASRYWPMQLIETGILLALAAAVVAVGSLRLRRSLVP